MRAILTATALVLALPTAAAAQESQAQSWGLFNEEKHLTAGTVVDVLCELAGDCPENCGDGARQLGLLEDDGTLRFAVKNTQPLFTGAAVDLLPYCGQRVETDGLLTGDGETRVYQIQLIRPEGGEEWVKTDRWTEVWNRNHPEAAGGGPWFRRSPLVKEQIEENGYLGLGPEADAAFIEANR